MNFKRLAVVVAAASLALAGCGKDEASSEVTLKTPELKVSYAIGHSMGMDAKDSGIDGLDPRALAMGMSDALAGRDLRLADEELQKAFEFVQDRAREKRNALNDATAQAGRDFLAENGKREGVVTTESGLQYEVLVKTDGRQPTPRDTVQVHYTGSLVDGTVFDSSIERGEPVAFPVVAVVPGWVEALQLMHVGEKYKLYIPSELGYGAQSPSPMIPANSTLIFEVELLDIVGTAEEMQSMDAELLEQLERAVEEQEAARGTAEQDESEKAGE